MMSPFSKWKTIGYAVAIFVAGGISGGALGVYETKSHLFEPQREQDVALHWRNRLQEKLGLTPDQMAKINPVIDNGVAQMRSIRSDTMQRLNKIFEDSYAKISAVLTPDQRTKLDQMDKERLEMMQQHWQENHHHPGGPGDSPHDGADSGPGSPPGPHPQ
jgi:hypothetical protein